MSKAAARQPAGPRTDELDDDTIRAWCRRTRAARGLGPKITDAATLAKLVTIALGPGRDGKGGNGDGP
jgi:hypothetical protein